MMKSRMLLCRLPRQNNTAPSGRRALSTEVPPGPPKQPGIAPEEPLPEPPNVFATVGAMGAGALGAVFIAAVGVWGVFKISFWVASETGRSLNAEKQAAVAAPAAPPAAGSPDGAAAAQRQAGTAPAGDVKAASPLEAWRPGAQLAPSFAAAAAFARAARGAGMGAWACRRWQA